MNEDILYEAARHATKPLCVSLIGDVTWHAVLGAISDTSKNATSEVLLVRKYGALVSGELQSATLKAIIAATY